MNDRFERFSSIISEISYNLHKITAQEMEKHGLKGPYAIYILTLHRYDDGLTAARLCELSNRDKSDVSRAVTMMIKKGLIQRDAGSYRSRLRLTELGKSSAEELRSLVERAVSVIDRYVSTDEREIMYSALGKIASTLSSIVNDEISLD